MGSQVYRKRRGRLKSVTLGIVLVIALAMGSSGANLPSGLFLSTAFAAPSTQYLHAAHVTVGSTVYNTVNVNAVSGTTATSTASGISANGVYTFSDTGGQSIFASNPVPTGVIWDLGGSWTFNLYARSDSGTGTGYLRATLWRISSGGVATLVDTTADSTSNVLGTTSYTLRTWSYTVSNFTLASGERFGIQFQVDVTNRGSVTSASMQYDLSSRNSRVTVPLTVEQVNEAHYRIGQDTPLSSMQWYANTDTTASGLQRGANFRVRFQVYNASPSSQSWTPRLEYATSTAGPWTMVPTASGSPSFLVAATSQFANGAAITTANFGLGTGTGTAQQGVAYNSQNPGGALTLNANSYTEIEFNVQANTNATYGTDYYFRFSDNGTPLASYNNYALVSLASPSPAHGDTGGYSSTTDACAKCHRGTHDSKSISLTYTKSGLPVTQESVCYTCHDGTGAPANIEAQFAKTYEHPIAANDVHRIGENQPGQLSGANRHVECADCHEPHKTAPGNHAAGSSAAGGVLSGQWGVDVANGGGWTVPSYGVIPRVTNEYQLCFKCHSSWAYDGFPPLSHAGGIAETNQALEFNVNNGSYHWVEGDKTASSGATPRTNDGRNMTFVGSWTKTSQMTCSDCHASDVDTDPRGPHGSTVAYMLRGAWTVGTGKTGTNNDLCFKCHDWNTYGQGGNASASATGFSNSSRNLHTYHLGRSLVQGCQSCHSAVPHGGNQTYTFSNGTVTVRSLLAPLRYGGNPNNRTGGTTVSDPPYNTNSKLWIGTWASSGQWSQSYCAYFTGGDPNNPNNYDH